MRILALETSTGRGSVALLDDGALVREVALPADRRTTESLAPTTELLLHEAGWMPRTVDLVAVTNGPGSFTGLRIAVTAAKTFAYVAQADLVAIDTLRVLVEQLPEDVTQACVVMDAQRQQLFAARYHRCVDGDWEVEQACHIIPRASLGQLLEGNTILTGPALKRVQDLAGDQHRRAAPECWMPRASTLGQLARRAHLAGHRDDPFALVPQYYRASYAEEKRG